MSSKKYSKSRPEELTYFIDRSLGKEPLASSLRALGWRVELHDDHFSQDAPDTLWLDEVGRLGWVVLSKDKHIRYRPLEREMFLESQCRVFVLTGSALNSRQIAEAFVRAAPKIERMVRLLPPPFLAHVSTRGKVTKPGKVR